MVNAWIVSVADPHTEDTEHDEAGHSRSSVSDHQIHPHFAFR